MADGAGVEGAVALDGRVDVGVVVDAGLVDGDAAAGLAADVPRRRRPQAPSPQDRVQCSHFCWISSRCLLSLNSCTGRINEHQPQEAMDAAAAATHLSLNFSLS